jgi:ADP-ribose pyrophosphatase
MRATDFNSFINEGKIKQTAGVAIKWQNKVLLVHPKNASWQHSALGIPKGGIEPGEDPIIAAIRELREETGIEIKESDLDSSPYTAENHGESGKLKSQLIYFTMTIDNPSEIGLTDQFVPKEWLQLEEIDWAGFVRIDDAYSKMHRSQIIILDRLR